MTLRKLVTLLVRADLPTHRSRSLRHSVSPQRLGLTRQGFLDLAQRQESALSLHSAPREAVPMILRQ